MRSHPRHPGHLSFAGNVLSGDPAARREFAERMGCVPAMLGSLNERIGRPLDPDDLKDVAQDVIAAVWRKLAVYGGHSTLESWVYPFCVLELSNSLRRRKRMTRFENIDAEGVSASLHLPAPIPEHSDIHDSLQKIDADHSRVVRMKQFDRMTFEEIALELSIPLSTAKTRYYRGIASLRDLLHSHDEGNS